MEWLLVALIVAVGLIGGYYHQLLIAGMKNGKSLNAWFGGWVFRPEDLDTEGKRYRRIIILCWVIAIALAVVAIQLGQ